MEVLSKQILEDKNIIFYGAWMVVTGYYSLAYHYAQFGESCCPEPKN